MKRALPLGVVALVAAAVAAGSPGSTGGSAAVWTPVGPPTRVRLSAVAVSASTPTIYAVANDDTLTVFRSTDLGRTWSERGALKARLTGNVDRVRVRGLAVAAGGTNRVFAATTAGLLVSSDGGASWREVGPGSRAEAVVAAPDRPVVYALVASPSLDLSQALRSPDGGETWEPLPLPGVASIAVAPGGQAALGAGSRVFVTQDDGVTWTSSSTGLRGTHVGVAVAGETWFAATKERVARSGNRGATWTIATGVKTQFIRGIAVDPARPTNVYILHDVFSQVTWSVDGGSSWSSATPFLQPRGAALTGLVIAHGKVFVLAPLTGLWWSGSGARTWGRANGPRVTGGLGFGSLDLPRLVTLGHGVLYAAFGDDVYRTRDGGRTWTPLGFGPGVVAVAASRAGVVYASKQNEEGVWKGGRGRPRRVFEPQFVSHSVVLSPSNPSIVFVSTWSSDHYDAQYRSTDGGRTWKAIDSGPLFDTDDPEFAVDPRDPRVVYAATCGNLAPDAPPIAGGGPGRCLDGVLKSVDGGSHWRFTPLRPRSSADSFSLLRVDSVSTRAVAACRSGGVLMRSDDAGAHWRAAARIAGGVASYVLDGPRTWAVSTSGVLFRSDDGARRWRRVADLELPSRSNRQAGCSGDPVLDPSSEALYTTTADGTLVRRGWPNS